MPTFAFVPQRKDIWAMEFQFWMQMTKFVWAPIATTELVNKIKLWMDKY
jgi:hypothetical protein